MVARHGLTVTDRHRALGDARAVGVRRGAVSRSPRRVHRGGGKANPAHSELAAAASRGHARSPARGPGVYLFYGDNPLPIYIGKSINLRDRVSAHFAGDWRSETDLRLSQEIRRIEFEETAGELGALLREATLVKSLLPALNRALRRKEEAGVLALADDGAPRFLCAAAIDPAGLALTYGPYASRRSARETLRAVAAEHGLCWRRLGLEKRASGPCFQRQLKRCAGACVGAEGPAEHDRRLPMPSRGRPSRGGPSPDPGSSASTTLTREAYDVHVLHHWCWLGTARDEGDLAALLDAPPRPRFDIDVARLLLKRWTRGSLALVDVTRGSI